MVGSRVAFGSSDTSAAANEAVMMFCLFFNVIFFGFCF